MKEKVLVVGGTGFIGRNLIKKLKQKNYSILSISLSVPSKSNKINNVKYYVCDISNKKELLNFLKKKKIEYVVNLGGYVDHSNKKKTYESHYKGLKNLVDNLNNKKIKKFIQIGSSLENANINSPQVENYKSSQSEIPSTYGRAKLQSTKYLLRAYKRNNFPVTVFRLFQTYGPGQLPNRLIPFVIDQCINNKIFPCSSGLQFRDFIYISDVVDILVKALKNKNSNGEIYNLGCGKGINVKKIILKVNKIIGSGEPSFGRVKLRKDEMRYIFADIKKIKKAFKWKPKISFNSGLLKTINYFKYANQKKIS